MIIGEGKGIGTGKVVPISEIPDADAPTELEAYYDARNKCYWVANSRSQWIQITETALKLRLRANGFSPRRLEGARLSAVEGKVLQIQTEHDVAYAGPLAGYSSGIVDSCGNRILVTSSPKLIHPEPGDWSTIRALFTNLLEDDRLDQVKYVWAWLKFAGECLREGVFRPAPLLVFAGPRDCGKSLCQNLITQLLGGRVAKCFRYMSGGTQFNGELLGAEHQMIEDETPSTNFKARATLGTRIKEFTMNEVQSLHAKGFQAISVRPFWRVTMSLNDDPENLLILPPMDDSMEDKISLLKVKQSPLPMPTRTLAERAAFWGQLVAELPALAAFLRDWEVPPELGDNRCGMRAIQHPALLEALTDLSAPVRLLRMLDTTFFAGEIPSLEATYRGDGGVSAYTRHDPTDPWTATAEEVEKYLLGTTFSIQARNLLHWPTATGTFLGQLARSHPIRVKPARTGDSRKWRIFPPEDPEPPNSGAGYYFETDEPIPPANEGEAGMGVSPELLEDLVTV